jgi:chloramphenicol 3-O-phosphotransferase
MLVRVQGTNVDLDDDLYAFARENLEDAFCALRALSRESVKVDAELEETTCRHPKEREDARRYGAETNITVPGGSFGRGDRPTPFSSPSSR